MLMPVVVTGAAGFIGGHLCKHLGALGEDVLAIDRRAAMPASAAPIVSDLSAPSDDAREALRDASAVFHLAARPGVRDDSPEAERQRHRDNVVATQAICDLVPRDVPLVVTSSSSVYGGARFDGGRLVPSQESDRLNPRGGYARSKVEVERICAARAESGGAVCVARPFTVVGEGQREDMALSRWIRAALDGQTITVFGSLERSRDFTDVRGVVRCLTALADTGLGRTVNIGTGHAQSLETALRAIFEVTGKVAPIEVVPAGKQEVEATLASTEQLLALTGFVPRTNLSDVVARHLSLLADEEQLQEEVQVLA